MTQASFEAAFIAPEEVTPKRLDANFYRATYRQAAQRAARLPSAPLSSLVKAGTVITYGVIKSVQIESGFPMLRIQNLQSGFADADGAVRISAEQHQSFSRSALSGGELLIAIGGYVGVAAKYPNDGPIANINQHVAKADIDLRRANDYYVLAYLWSQTGTLLLQRTRHWYGPGRNQPRRPSCVYYSAPRSAHPGLHRREGRVGGALSEPSLSRA